MKKKSIAVRWTGRGWYAGRQEGSLYRYTKISEVRDEAPAVTEGYSAPVWFSVPADAFGEDNEQA